MSRNIIVGLAVLVVAIIAWIVIDNLSEPEVAGVDGVDGVTAPVEEDEVIVEEAIVPEPVEEVEAPVELEEPVIGDVEITEDAPALVDEGEDVTMETLENVETEASEIFDEAGETAEDGVNLIEEGAAETDQALENIESDTTAIFDDAAEETGEALDAAGDEIAEETDEALATVDEAAEAVEVEMTEEAAEMGAEVEAATDDEGTVALETETVSADELNITGGDETDSMLGDGDLAELLTPENFNADEVIIAIEESDLDETTRLELLTAVEQARQNPDMVDAVVVRVRESLGIE
ncbi:hypothetical protein JSE7799_00862 [Jannaschia seosinensis]|uniref:Uncharacterized protein n=1 Tax=Jannaschia seosinensis TaxID=313367 RepID=A0A0M7B5S9_9RHOB|nr:hypothetical protein [Jannaschia seosinensis]CUH29971.1 hypothetical protein JSE7799_00862 [Jannaschia seosinensis]